MIKISLELEYISSTDFKLGEYIYIGKGLTDGGINIVMSIGYKIDYAIKKALQAETKTTTFTHITKVKVGELVFNDKFFMTKEICEHFINKYNIIKSN